MIDFRNCCCMELMSTLPDKSQDLIIVDPPYFEVKGKFDFVWESFDAYLSDVEKWAKEIKRVMADNGTLFWWGHAKKIAYSQLILDKYFNIENSLIWEKAECQTMAQDFEAGRIFAPVTERLLMYSNGTEPEEWDRTGWEAVKADVGNFQPLREYFRQFQEALGLSKTAILDEVGGKADHCFRWGSTQWDLPTEETYAELCKLPLKNDFIRKEYEELRKEYEELRKEYEELRRPFNNYMKLTDVLKFSQEAHITGKIAHPTQKPPKLCSVLIRTCSKKGQNLLIPFGGSGVEIIEGEHWGLNVTASELCPEYYALARERIRRETAQMSLF